MPVLDATFVGKLYLPEVSTGPVPPGPGYPVPPGGVAPPLPTHPIVIPPDAIAPGVPTHPIYLPVYPEHPIVIPPDAVGPGLPAHPIVLPPEPPPGYWGGIAPPYPSHPIVIPPEAIVPEPSDPTKAHLVVYYNSPQGPQRITFTVDLPDPTVPAEPAPKPA
jgi:hypothetical protein